MPQVINTNVVSLNAQRNLNTSSKAMATALQRLSSSLRINSAKDDAAGLAISQRMTAQVNGLNQAVRNANDGISLAQVAEGAMQETTNILQRMRELAVQAANSTNNSGDKANIQTEVSNLQSELTRISNTTEFNGQRILDGSFTNASFQVGANSNQTISFSIGSVAGSAMGSIATGTGTNVAAAAATDITIAIGGAAASSIASSANYAVSGDASRDSTSAYAKAAAINASGISGLSVTASTSGTQTVGAIGGTAGDTYSLSINGVSIYTNTDVAAGLTNTQLLNAINNVSNQTGVVASLNGGDMTLTAADGRNIAVTESGTGFTAGTDGLTVTGGDFAATLRGALTFTASDTINIGGTTANIGSSSIAKDTLGVDSIDVSTAAGAQTAIARLDSAINYVSTNRAVMGAIQNRFDSTTSNLQSISENLSAARSRILDTDYAAETANLTKNQILQQAGTAMLSQANSLPQSVLSLLK